jgi:ComF family protein
MIAAEPAAPHGRASVYAGCVSTVESPPSNAPSAPAARAAARVRGLWSSVLPLRRILAPRCVLCGLGEADPVCAACRDDFLPADVHRCRLCAQRLGPAPGDLCGRCLRDPPAFDATLTLADYAPPVDGLVIALKFGHRLDVARALGLMLARRIDELVSPEALLTVVPLAFERQRERGFNQALEIARVAAAQSARPLLPHALLRTRHRPAQEGLSLDARRRNVRGAFAVERAAQAQLAGRTLVVIDDVMTSGSTLDEVARVLRRAGAERVINAVVARTP